jgi:GntR family transcriptional regulator
MTISKAFGLMEAAGLLERRRGLSMVVAQQHQQAQSAASRIELLRPALAQAAQQARQLELDADQALQLFKTLLDESARP